MPSFSLVERQSSLQMATIITIQQKWTKNICVSKNLDQILNKTVSSSEQPNEGVGRGQHPLGLGDEGGDLRGHKAGRCDGRVDLLVPEVNKKKFLLNQL